MPATQNNRNPNCVFYRCPPCASHSFFKAIFDIISKLRCHLCSFMSSSVGPFSWTTNQIFSTTTEIILVRYCKEKKKKKKGDFSESVLSLCRVPSFAVKRFRVTLSHGILQHRVSYREQSMVAAEATITYSHLRFCLSHILG